MFSKSNFVEVAAAGLIAARGVLAEGPCDIYASGGTPCVAAHSSTRALFGSYNGALYQITRNSDGATTDIAVSSAGGVADSAAQESFCQGATCVISILYDQTGNGNNLSRAPPGGSASGPNSNGDDLAAADGAPVKVQGSTVYGVFSSPGTGYRNDDTTHIPTGNDAQGIYAVLDGTHYNDACCYDYGNAETNNVAQQDGTMQALYFGQGSGYTTGAGNGPWLMIDLENGLYNSNSESTNENNPSQTSRFVTGFVKGDTSNLWALRGGDSTGNSIETYYSGSRPNGYYPMQMQGALILGIGGDNSDYAQGTFYEGAVTSGYPSDSTENAVQANIAAAGYTTAPMTSGPSFTVGSSVSFRVTTPGFNTRYIMNNGTEVITYVVNSSSASNLKEQASFIVRQGLAQSDCYTFESVAQPGYYIRHSSFELYINENDGSATFQDDATYCPQAGLNGQGNSIRSFSYPTRYFRHYYNVLYAASQGGPQAFDQTYSYANDVSFVVSTGFAS